MLISYDQISGDLDLAKDALIQVMTRLRANLFDREGAVSTFVPVLPYIPVSENGSDGLNYESRDSKRHGRGPPYGGYGSSDLVAGDSYGSYGGSQVLPLRKIWCTFSLNNCCICIIICSNLFREDPSAAWLLLCSRLCFVFCLLYTFFHMSSLC